jgi:hypothetical protein
MVGAVMLTSVLGNGSDSGSEDDEVGTPITSHHYKWICNIWGNISNDPVTVNTLLDCRAHVVLIELSVVEKLGLCCFQLFKPLPVSNTLHEAGVKASQLLEYIKITVFSKDSAWTSSTIKAVITSNLCTPLLLGTPFLQFNHIVMDFKAGTAIDKRCNYNLLNPPKIT